MSCLEKTLSPEQWLMHLERTVDPAERARVDLHLATCDDCREIRDRLLLSRSRLAESARLERLRNAATEGALTRIWDSLRFQIRRARGEGQLETPDLDLRQLRSILVSMCGEATAEGALHKALPQDARFAKNLGSIVEVICGTRAARFVEHAAQSTHKDMVA